MEPDLSLFPNRLSVAAEIWDARDRSCAHRLLAGAGQAAVVAYHENPMLVLTAVAHGMMADGTIVVATAERELDDHLEPDEARDMDVRLSIEKESPDPTVQIVSAAVHSLGKAQWIGPDETAELLVAHALPARVAAVAAARGARLAKIATGRVLLHDAAGVAAVTFETVLEQHRVAAWEAESGAELYGVPGGELVAMDILGGYPPRIVNALFDGILSGSVPGALLSRQRTGLGCELMDAAILCLDIDRTGLTLMKVDREEATTAYVPFGRPVATGVQLAFELGALFESNL